MLFGTQSLKAPIPIPIPPAKPLSHCNYSINSDRRVCTIWPQYIPLNINGTSLRWGQIPGRKKRRHSSGRVWMWELDCKGSWVLRIDAFELWCWRRLLRVSWTARRSNQSIVKEISPGCSLEGLMLKLKLQYFGHLMQRADSFKKTLMLGKTEGRKKGW